jgi:transcriptional regulator with XRE-family HTH domain
LRREEVASLAGVSIAYYTKLERGDASGVSDTVLEALSRALQLDDAERAHLFDLVRAQQPVPRPRRRRTAPQTIRPGVQRLLDRIDAPAYIRNGRMDILATNKLGEALGRERGRLRRRLAGRGGPQPARPGPDEPDRRAIDAKRRLRVRWARHDVGTHDTGIKRLHHSLVGQLELTYEGMTLAADPDLVMFAFTAEVRSNSDEALNLLASWAATENQPIAADTSDRY